MLLSRNSYEIIPLLSTKQIQSFIMRLFKGWTFVHSAPAADLFGRDASVFVASGGADEALGGGGAATSIGF